MGPSLNLTLFTHSQALCAVNVAAFLLCLALQCVIETEILPFAELLLDVSHFMPDYVLITFQKEGSTNYAHTQILRTPGGHRHCELKLAGRCVNGDECTITDRNSE